MKKCTWKKYTASVLVAAMLAAQPMAVYADEASTASQAAYSDTEAKDINGVYERVSDKVAGMLANGELTYSETSGYLYNASGSKVDPETGAEIPDTTETGTKAPETETKAPETTETETKASETSASETETESQTGTGESETESQTEATDTETGTTETETTETGSETESESQSETASSETTTPGSSSDNASASTDSKATESQTTAETGSNTQQDVSYKASGVFKKIGDRVQYNVDVPIKGLPSFITQEMIVGALKSQDEYGYPASVTGTRMLE